MKCPKCGKDIELQKKQVGVDENGKPILNEYAICRDCKKQWNLDKQRAVKAAKATASENRAATQPTPDAGTAVKEPSPAITPVSKEIPAPKKEVAPKKASVPEKASAASEKPTAPGERPARKKRPAQPGPVPADKKPVPRKRPVPSTGNEHKPADAKEEQRYGNIPPEKVRKKSEKAVKDNYDDMLSHNNPARQKPAEPAKKQKKTPPKVMKKQKKEVSKPKFRVIRVILGILSIFAFVLFAYKGFIAGLTNIANGSNADTGTIFIILALCMLVSGLLLLIMQKKRTIFAFILPAVFYLGSAVCAFLKRGDDSFLLYGAIAGAVLTVLFIILAVCSKAKGNKEDEEDYDDPFDEDHDNY